MGCSWLSSSPWAPSGSSGSNPEHRLICLKFSANFHPNLTVFPWESVGRQLSKEEDTFPRNLPPSSSESDMNVSCMDSGALTRYFSSTVVVVVVVTSCSVTTLSVSTTLM